jgi:hypothetical protein
VKEIRNVWFGTGAVMASFDIVSLFTNVPLAETCQIAADKLYASDTIVPFDKKTFTKLLKIACAESVFLFNKVLYKQIDGCSMGGPASPTLANVFLCNFEKLWLDQCPPHFKPLLYRRYVDDCFLIFKDTSHVQLFLDYLNSQHSNIKFTSEIETDNCLHFLDATIEKLKDKYSTSVYRKTTFTGLGLNFFSFLPKLYKINSIRTLIYRAYVISSDYISLHLEIEKLKTFFVNNLYPVHLVDDIIGKFLESRFGVTDKELNVPKLKKYIKLPFFGRESYKVRNELRSILKRSFNHVDFRFVFSNSFTIGSFFNIKDRIPNDVRSCVVYEYNCSGCNARYIGSTIRSFKARRMEHFGRSIHTGRPITTPEFSSIRIHSETHNHPLSHDNFKIVKSMPNQQALLVAESIIIKQQKPSLNSNTRSIELFTIH